MSMPVPMEKVMEVANALVWKTPNLRVLPREPEVEYSALAKILQLLLEASHKRGKLMLPDLGAYTNKSVGVFSDYAGESTGDYYTYSFLVCALDLVATFTEKMKEARGRHALGEKEIAFKDFGMGQLQRILPEYLNLLDGVPGFLFTLVIEKGIKSLFTTEDTVARRDLAETLKTEGFGTWKRDSAEKLMRIVHTSALLTALLARSEQKLFWMSDDDEICPNAEQHQRALNLFGRLLGLYREDAQSFALIGGATPFNTRHLDTLDLLSLADVVASSVEHYMTKRNKSAGPDFSVKVGAHHVLQWLAHDGIGLKKMTSIIRRVAGGFQGAELVFDLAHPPENVTIIPVVV